MNILPGERLELVTRHVPGPELKPADIIRAVFGLSDAEGAALRILKTEQTFGP